MNKTKWVAIADSWNGQHADQTVSHSGNVVRWESGKFNLRLSSDTNYHVHVIQSFHL